MAEALRDTGWFKSSYSGSGNDQCVEVRLIETTIGVRDSKNPAGPSLRLHSPAWTGFLASLVRE